MAFFVYILRSLKDGRLYVGSTNDVARRFRRHNLGLVTATKLRRPLELVCFETFGTRSEAVQRERHLKSLEGSGEKKRLVSQGLGPGRREQQA
jgi:putative endonuclease